MPPLRPTRLGAAALVGAGLLFSFAPILVRLSELGPTATAFWRFAIALPVLWLVTGVRGDRVVLPARRIWSRDGRLLLLASVIFAASTGLWQAAAVETSIANATLLNNMHPIYVALAAWLMFGETVGRMFFLGLALALVGMLILVPVGLSGMGSANMGDLYGLLSGLTFGGWILCLRGLGRRFATSVTHVTHLAIASVALLAASLTLGEPLWPPTAVGWLVLVAFALTANVIGQSAFTYAAGRVPAALSSLSMLMIPVGATLFAWLLFDETLSPLQLFAAALVLSGIILAQISQTDPSPSASSP